ncbi:MAG: hypothetical protein KDB00_28960 [Planctomycetales bacterium]|nr:hypothetical protein [Planctomycetales bacterium]
MNSHSIWRAIAARSACLFIASALFLLVTPTSARAETWTDSTGKFKIDAEYAGVKGTSVVLRLPDGTTKEVPIARLSTESRDRAKELYQAAKANPASTPLSTTKPVPANPPALSVSSPPSLQREEPDFAPVPPPVSPMPAFPESASLQETVDFVVDQMLAGHPEVLWYAMPDDVRAQVDSQEVRDAMRPGVEMTTKMSKPISDLAMKICEVAIRKKQFILNSQYMGAVPPQINETIQKVYDPAAGLVYEYSRSISEADLILEGSIDQWIKDRGPRFGGHMKGLAQALPAEAIQQFRSSIEVNQTSDSTGTVTIPNQNGPSTPMEMVKYRGRWVPKEFAEKWEEKGGDLASGLKQQFEESQKQLEQSQAQMAMMSGMITGMSDQILKPMLEANTQQEFDAAVGKAIAMAGMLGGGGGPGFGGPGPGPGNPAFGQ